MRHAGTQTLETDRLFLRQLLPEDAEQMYTNWASDPEVTRFLRWEPHKNALETVGLLAAWATLYPNPDYYQWAIVEKASGQVFGSISIFNALLGDPAQKALWPQQDCTDGIWEAGYCIGKHWWNHGFATEALKAAVNYWFENTDGGWLTCCHAKENPASGRVMEKAGFLYHIHICTFQANIGKSKCTLFLFHLQCNRFLRYLIYIFLYFCLCLFPCHSADRHPLNCHSRIDCVNINILGIIIIKRRPAAC